LVSGTPNSFRPSHLGLPPTAIQLHHHTVITSYSCNVIPSTGLKPLLPLTLCHIWPDAYCLCNAYACLC